ncbi:GNAT family N-acetyltransferase [Paenibacillus sp. R14(2021)]|uniref:GNAT family N-acetyltransferase n=1 Tax=Paenibacillus sp. R14(2021) TaxID=2859228 RepID=UPI001C615974|nr:GNAT family N-acetyltransferase [Paenibacillus sp. R14(2021)]
MFTHRSLMGEDLRWIASFPQSADELFYVSPRFHYPLTPDQIMKLLEYRRLPTVVIDAATGHTAGYANLYDCQETSCWLGNVIVSPRYRGQGAAEVLLKTMMHKAKSELHMQKLLLSCHQTNARGLAFYHKHGFKPYDMKRIPMENKRDVITIQMAIDL